MNIQTIKENLSITEVLTHYGYEPNRNKMLNCPFHADKTPSMQIYPETNTAYCFSSNCELQGKSIDQIDFIMHKEGISKSEAITKAKELSGLINVDPQTDYETIFPTLRKNLLRSPKAQKYLKERKLEITTLSENALYYFDQTELKNKLVLIEDLDGAQDDKILYALRELMSKKQITKTIPIKDSKGNLKTITLQVEGPISLSGTTTREKLYEDNANRSILIYLDNSKTHKDQIMDYQRSVSAGQINKNTENEVKELFKDIQSVLRPIKVVNPYATKLNIPETDFKPLRTNSHYLSFIEVITFYKQYQRKIKINKNGEDYIETTLEDIKEANELLREVLLSKSDELTKASRNFLEMLKHQLNQRSKDTFYRSEIRTWIRINPHNLRYYLSQLHQYGYLKIIGGNKYKQGYEYELTNKKEYETLKTTINTSLDKSLKNLVASVANSCELGQLATQLTASQSINPSC